MKDQFPKVTARIIRSHTLVVKVLLQRTVNAPLEQIAEGKIGSAEEAQGLIREAARSRGVDPDTIGPDDIILVDP
jgi:hypothetical protein